MITEYDLQAAIAECQGHKNPNRDTCMMLAAFYTIQDHLYPKAEEPPAAQYSFASGQTDQVSYDSGTAFSDAIQGKDMNEVLAVMDEAMTTIQALLPRLYNGIMQELTD